MTAELLRQAIGRRGALLSRLHAEGTDCYRLFHGVSEGRPGLAIDRYGPILLLQTWREPLSLEEVEAFRQIVASELGVGLEPVWNHRNKKPDQSFRQWHEVARGVDPVGRELGIRYRVDPRHRGVDPLLFLDFRVGRRCVREAAESKSVLNLFAYTCGIGLAALAGGAKEVWNVDFSRSSLAFGKRNLMLNGFSENRCHFVNQDVLPVVRQLAGLPVKGRASRRRSYQVFEPRRFDIVVLDPPPWSKGPFGAVDVVRDYPSLFKPALLAAEASGRLLVTNNAPEVTSSDWLRVLSRTGEKCGRPLAGIELLKPEEDFPSFDAAPPLKVAWIAIA